MHSHLLRQLVQRELSGRYKGSLLGFLWALLNPILLLVVYGFFFGVVFQGRWGDAHLTTDNLAINLFAGMIVHSFLAEVLTRSPQLILGHVNYVKKVVFPLELLPLALLGSVLAHFAVAFLVLLLFLPFVHGLPAPTVLLVPLVIAPLAVLSLGIAWLLAAAGVYLRDIGQLMGFFSTALLFMAPVFYPLTALPEWARLWLYLNPLTFVIEQVRALTFAGQWPDWTGLLIYSATAVLVATGGLAFFRKARRGFADVL